METRPSAMLRLPAIFSEHMVVRAERANPIWGWARVGAEVMVSFRSETKKTLADSMGKWRLELSPAPAGGPYLLTVASEKEVITLSDVLAGEVWLCSGQSNMEWTVWMAKNSKEEIAAANYPQMRLLNIPGVARSAVQSDVDSSWELCSPKTAAQFSAVGYFFGRELHQDCQLPIGLINSSWGGTVAEAWTEWSALEGEPAFANFMDPYRAMQQGDSAEWKRKNQLVIEWRKVERYQDPGNRAYFKGWADLETDESAWRDFAAPGFWKEDDMHHRGAVWFRKTVTVPKEWSGQALTLSLGALHDFDTTYFNGEKVGGLGKETPNAWNTPRVYTIPAALVRPGETNTIATRVFVEFDLGGFTGGGPLVLYPEGTPIESGLTLVGNWKYRAEYAFDATVPSRVPIAVNGPNCESAPSNLYNAMIAPLAPYGLTGTIWYQGESNAGRAEQYKILFPRLIESWRKAFENPEMPFFFVLLAGYMPLQERPVEEGWGEIREAQLEALKLAHTGVASAIDLGDAVDIHPQDKQSVGHRLALIAKALLHKQEIVYSGPSFHAAKREGDEVRLQFHHTGSGLKTQDGERPRGFAVLDATGNWQWGEAEIKEDDIVLRAPGLTDIWEVRYAWASNPIGNLCNKEGLPALPFRSDVSWAT